MERVIEHGSAEYDRAVELRNRVLRAPLGLCFDPADLELESSDFHLGLFQSDELVATLVLTTQTESEVKMRQVAVAPEFQRQGLGRRLVAFSEDFAKSKGFGVMVLNARDTAIEFYLRLGYEAYGELFEEVTIPHQAMRKSLG